MTMRGNVLQRWLIVATMILAAALSVVIAKRHHLWVDEVFSIAIATGHSLEHPADQAVPALGDFVEKTEPQTREAWLPYLEPEEGVTRMGNVIRATRLSDTSPPLYYILLSGWIRVLGTGDLAVRAFSIAAYIATIPLLAYVARRTAGKAAVLPSCLAFAMMPLAVYYGSEARMYALLWLVTVATAAVGLRARLARHRIPALSLLAVVSATGFLTHYFYAFSWAGILAYLFWKPGRIRRAELVMAVALTMLFILPWFVKLPEILAAWRVTQDWLKQQPWGFSRTESMWQMLSQVFTGNAEGMWGPRRRARLLALAALAGGIVLALVMRRHKLADHRLSLPIIWFLGAWTGPLVFDMILKTHTIIYVRYIGGGIPAACLIIGALAALIGKWPRRAMLAALVLAWIPNLVSIHRTTGRGGFKMAEVLAAVGPDTTERDLIIVHSIPSGLLNFARYYDGPSPIAAWVGQLGRRQVPGDIVNLAAGREDIVFVRIHHVWEPAPQEDWLKERADLIRTSSWDGDMVTVSVFRLDPHEDSD